MNEVLIGRNLFPILRIGAGPDGQACSASAGSARDRSRVPVPVGVYARIPAGGVTVLYTEKIKKGIDRITIKWYTIFKNKEGLSNMDDKDIVRSAMKLKKMTQAQLAEACGLKGQSGISMLLTRKLDNGKNTVMTIASWYKLLNAMDCEIIVRDKSGSGTEWKFELEENMV